MTETNDHSWFGDLGLGLFITWGHASTRGWELSWQMTGGVTNLVPELEPVACEEYFANAGTFNPEGFDAQQWAEIAWAAGCRYVVFTTKHHDGFAMYDTKLSDYSITNNTFGRDITRELFDAFRAKGMAIGVYFSLIDWSHEDYPRLSDEAVCKPYVVGTYPRGTDEQWVRFHHFMMGQLRELLTSYGPIDIVWLDGEFEHSEEEWDFAAIRELVRELHPRAVVNNRIGKYGDFATPEQMVPIFPPDGLWETCLTMNQTWGWDGGDSPWKSPTRIIHTLVEAASGGGNLLLNVGPMGDGTFPPKALEILSELGAWMDGNAESIRGVQRGLPTGRFYAPSTQRVVPDGGRRIYLHLTSRPYGRVAVRELPVRRIKSVSILADGRELPYVTEAWLSQIQQAVTDPLGDLWIDVADSDLAQHCTVVCVDIAPEGS